MILADTLWLNIFINLLLVLQVVVSLLLVMIIMMQRPKQEGLGAAFGGGTADSLFGARTTNVLQKGTVYLGTTFFLLALILAILIGQKNKNVSLTSDTPTEMEVTATHAGVAAGPATVDAEGETAADAEAASLEEELQRIQDEARAAEERREVEQTEEAESAAPASGVETEDVEADAETAVEEAPVEEPAPAADE